MFDTLGHEVIMEVLEDLEKMLVCPFLNNTDSDTFSLIIV